MPPYTHFLTFKGKKTRHQTVGWPGDKLRKISKNYFIVRERNKISDGYHFHALAVLEKDPPKGWFMKGVHMHCSKIGDLRSNESETLMPPARATAQELDEEVSLKPLDEAEDALIEYGMEKLRVRARRSRLRNKHALHLRRITDYIMKEDPKLQYVDYIKVENGKNVVHERAQAPVAQEKVRSPPVLPQGGEGALGPHRAGHQPLL